MSVKRRVVALEKQAGFDDDPRLFVLLDHGDGMVTVRDETMTEAEFQEWYQPREVDHVLKFVRRG